VTGPVAAHTVRALLAGALPPGAHRVEQSQPSAAPHEDLGGHGVPVVRLAPSAAPR